MDISTTLFAFAATLAGIAVHRLYFHRYETHKHGLQIIFTFIAAYCVLLYYNAATETLLQSLVTTNAISTSFLTGAYGSLLTYRMFENPLNAFPGPWWARFSSLWFSFQLGKSDSYLKLKELHDRYGPIVRIGSSDLSIVDAAFMEKSFGTNSRVTKSSWYDVDPKVISLHTSRSRELHDKRRKVWAPAFSDKALREYGTRIDRFNDKVIQRFGEFNGGAVNVSKWFNLYSFDVMGSLAFGKDYGMLDSGEKHWAIQLLGEGMAPFGFQLPSWMFGILTGIPGLAAGYQKFVDFCVGELKARIRNAEISEKEGGQDILSWLLKGYRGFDRPEEDSMLQADARLIIVAGVGLLSDTTAAALTYLFYELARDPSHVKRLREELQPLARGEWSDKDIRHAEHLNGAINEALRLHPPVPSGVSRLTPHEGLQVGDTFVPGNVTFIMPQYMMGRDEANYIAANAFVPERWYSKAEMVKQKDAFAPFSTGPFNCIGKNLGLMELRTLTARLVLQYDVAFAPGEDGSRILGKTLDHFTVDLGELDLGFTKI